MAMEIFVARRQKRAGLDQPVCGVLLFISPWGLGFAGDMAAARTAWVGGVVIAVMGIAALVQFAEWEDWVALIAGVLMIIAPWALRLRRDSLRGLGFCRARGDRGGGFGLGNLDGPPSRRNSEVIATSPSARRRRSTLPLPSRNDLEAGGSAVRPDQTTTTGMRSLTVPSFRECKRARIRRVGARMRPPLVSAVLAALALAACNAPGPAGFGAAGAGIGRGHAGELPACRRASDCNAEIARYRAVQDNDLVDGPCRPVGLQPDQAGDRRGGQASARPAMTRKPRR